MFTSTLGPASVRPTTPKCSCSICSREVGPTSIQCIYCKRWVHSNWTRSEVEMEEVELTLLVLAHQTRFKVHVFRDDMGDWICSSCEGNPSHCAPVSSLSPIIITPTHTVTPTISHCDELCDVPLFNAHCDCPWGCPLQNSDSIRIVPVPLGFENYFPITYAPYLLPPLPALV